MFREWTFAVPNFISISPSYLLCAIDQATSFAVWIHSDFALVVENYQGAVVRGKRGPFWKPGMIGVALSRHGNPGVGHTTSEVSRLGTAASHRRGTIGTVCECRRNEVADLGERPRGFRAVEKLSIRTPTHFRPLAPRTDEAPNEKDPTDIRRRLYEGFARIMMERRDPSSS